MPIDEAFRTALARDGLKVVVEANQPVLDIGDVFSDCLAQDVGKAVQSRGCGELVTYFGSGQVARGLDRSPVGFLMLGGVGVQDCAR